MVKTGDKKRYGLVGRDIAYSFSKAYFNKKFKTLGLETCQYENFDLPAITEFPLLLSEQPGLAGLNVTIPYKEAIMPYLDSLSPEAEAIGAVNTIAFTPEGLIGHNTDCYGFHESLRPFLDREFHSAFILGTGGASKAIAYVLGNLEIPYHKVSRTPAAGELAYSDLDSRLDQPVLLINCTPLGTYPGTAARPPIPYERLDSRHLLYDLVYNPAETAFMKAGRKQGAAAVNGLNMLELQAEKAWSIWTG